MCLSKYKRDSSTALANQSHSLGPKRIDVIRSFSEAMALREQSEESCRSEW